MTKEVEQEKRRILVTLTPSESKRLIAKGVKNLEVVQRALKHGTVVVGLGTTNAFVAEEILSGLGEEAKIEIEKQRYAAGVVTARGTCIVAKAERERDLIIKKGRVSEISKGDRGEEIKNAVEELSAGDVFIKGANALDASGTAGVLLAHPTGGTIGSALGTVLARGVNFVIPVGIEKTIPFPVAEAAKRVGIERFYKSAASGGGSGVPVGLMPVHGKVVTEVEALKILGAEDAFPFAAGGVDGGEGSVVLCAESSEENAEKLEALAALVAEIKGEPPVKLEGVAVDCGLQ
ncbi:hypothetical protein B6V00_01560 [ANME-1 cluster archaeon ex4572_4]|nr:MAG: hypothetical protein B6V00_01560 [ANME-1 cluster archaeon ex4572_4]